MDVLPADRLEARAQDLGMALLRAAQTYRPSIAERLQDRLLVATASDAELQRHLLGFVDVLSGLGFDRSGETTAALAREYLAGPFPGSPRLLQWGIRGGLAPLVPNRAVAVASRRMASFMASRFIVEPGPKSLMHVLDRLHDLGRYPSFDLLGEQVLSEGEAEQYAQRYVDLVKRLRPRASGPALASGTRPLQVSLKLSSLTSHFNPLDPDATFARVQPRLEKIAAAARLAGVGLTVDAEQYELRDLTWCVFQRFFAAPAWRDWDGAGVVIQAYLRDAAAHARDVVSFARSRAPMQVRLVKGAYWDFETILGEQRDWPVPVFTVKDNTDAEFEAVAGLLLEATPAIRLAVASHNLRSHAYAEALREARGMAVGTLEHQVLYRTAESTARALAGMGWPVRDYVPAGELLPAMAYLARRILENSSQAGFLAHARVGESASSLLRPPASQREPERARPVGFVNSAPPRLFLPGPRSALDAALAAVSGANEVFRLDGDDPTREIIDSHDPAGGVAGRVEMATLFDAKEAVQRANGAEQTWGALPVSSRAAILRVAADLMHARRDVLAAWVVREGGKVASEAYGDVDEAIDFLRYYAQEAERLPWDGIAPRGVVAVIPPWNFPLAIPTGMVAAALVTGNAVILKPAEETPIVSRRAVDILHQAGVPRDVLTWLPGEGEVVGRHLVESPDIDMVAFTGSRAVGQYIFETCAGILTTRGRPKEAVTETGGKNPLIVCADADLDDAIRGVLKSAFAQANQKCSAASRVLVERPVAGIFIERLREAAAGLVVGPGADPDTDIPPVISTAAAARIRAAAAAARTEGRILLDRLETGREQFLGPLIVEIHASAAGSARTAQEEIFGPVLTVVPFDSLQSATDIANGVQYGLTSGVFTRSRERMDRLIHEIDAGHVYVNRETIAARPSIEPFGGRKLSGTGPKAGGEEYLWAFVAPHPSPPAGRVEATTAAAIAAVAEPWREPVEVRLRVLRRAARQLEGADEAAARAVLTAVDELAKPQPVRHIPGQRSYVDWSAPRGSGLLAVADDAAPGTEASFAFAALLAGNGLSLVSTPRTAALFEMLRMAGVPEASLRMVEGAPEDLARQAFHFGTGSLAAEQLRNVRTALAKNEPGLPIFRQWIGPDAAPIPGHVGFVRRFALPKAVAINTLRHAVDLGD